MPTPIIRKRFFVAVEGESEQSFVKWLQTASDRIHLDCVLLNGGGFESMLRKAILFHQQNSRRGAYKDRFLVVDADRVEHGDWPIEKLRREAMAHKITVCLQTPNHEGVLLRMMPGMEREFGSRATIERKLKNQWPNYEKPMNAQALSRKFVIGDLFRVAAVDGDLKVLLNKIGLMTEQ